MNLQEKLYKALIYITQSQLSFSDCVPKAEQEWTSFDQEALTYAIEIIARYEHSHPPPLTRAETEAPND